jgi:ketosteroid isomerase-like protein
MDLGPSRFAPHCTPSSEAEAPLATSQERRDTARSVSQENVENAKLGYAIISDAVKSGDWDAVRRYVEERFDPEVVLKPAGVLPETEEMHGHDGVVRFLAAQSEAFDALRIEPLEFLEAADRLVVTVRVTGHARHSGIKIEFDRSHVFRYRDGKVLRMEVYANRAEALEAVGLRG